MKAIFPALSLRVRLVLLVIAIDVFSGALTGSVIVWTARSATKLELDATLRLADVLVADTLRMMQNVSPDLLMQTIDLQFRGVRHVRITVADAQNRPIRAASSLDTQAMQSERTSGAPAWFARAVAPPPQVEMFPLLVKNRLEGTVTVAAEPADEIGEAWQYAGAILATGLCLNLAVFGALFVLFGRALKPLDALVGGLANLERRDYTVRLARPNLPELAVIADHFNHAAGALMAAYGANRLLNRKLLAAQDDERRRTALELHDEVGPYLFALDVAASSIVAAAIKREGHPAIGLRAEEVVTLTKQVQSINRRVLDRLRPMSLGRIPLEDCLLRVVMDFHADDGPAIEPQIGPLAESYGALVDLTIYRCVQEGLLNAVRHAAASRIVVTIVEEGEPPKVRVAVRDDGRGLSATERTGLGLAGMRERVEALEGSFELESSPGGTTMRIVLAVESGEPAEPREASKP